LLQNEMNSAWTHEIISNDKIEIDSDPKRIPR